MLDVIAFKEGVADEYAVNSSIANGDSGGINVGNEKPFKRTSDADEGCFVATVDGNEIGVDCLATDGVEDGSS